MFGYKSPEDNYIAHTINDVFPGAATDGIPGPNSKVRRATGALPPVNEREQRL